MIAHALLVVIAANEHTDQPAPAGIIPLTCSEIRRLLLVLAVTPRRRPAAREPGQPGNDVINTEPASSTTAARNSSATAITIYGWSIRDGRSLQHPAVRRRERPHR